MTSPLGPVTAIVVRTHATATAPTTTPQSRMMLFPEEGQGAPVLIPYAPNEVEYGGLTGTFNTLSRAGLADALFYLKPSLKTLSFTLQLIDKELRNGGSPVATTISTLNTISLIGQYAASGTKMRLAYSSLEAGSWRITKFTVTSINRDEDDEVTQASADLELTQASDITTASGPVTGGVTVTAPVSTPPPAAAPAATASYTVKKGDTLWAIAVKYYNNGNKWTVIASANGISDPRTLQIGKVLRIP